MGRGCLTLSQNSIMTLGEIAFNTGSTNVSGFITSSGTTLGWTVCAKAPGKSAGKHVVQMGSVGIVDIVVGRLIKPILTGLRNIVSLRSGTFAIIIIHARSACMEIILRRINQES